MGGRDHACEVCGRGGFNNDEECVCPPDPVSPGEERVTTVAEEIRLSAIGGKAYAPELTRWAEHLEAVEAERDEAKAKLSLVTSKTALDVVAENMAAQRRARDAEARAERAEEALAELVRLKDGPRGAAYERDKPEAWGRAREVLAALDRGKG